MVKDGLTRRGALGGMVGAAAAPHVAAAQLAYDQVADMIEVQRIFIDLDLADAEAATTDGQFFKRVDSEAKTVTMYRREAVGSTELYSDATSAALAAKDGLAKLGTPQGNAQDALDRRLPQPGLATDISSRKLPAAARELRTVGYRQDSVAPGFYREVYPDLPETAYRFGDADGRMWELHEQLSPTPYQYGAVGDGTPHFLGEFFRTEAEVASAYPAAYKVFQKFWNRVPRTKPSGVAEVTLGWLGDPLPGNPGDWRNQTIDTFAFQEMLETLDFFIVPPALRLIHSDTLLCRRDGQYVDIRAPQAWTRGGSRGNSVAIGENRSRDLEGTRRGMTISGLDLIGDRALGDNGITLFQNQLTIADKGWESLNAARIILLNPRTRRYRRDRAASGYGGGKGISVQLGSRECTIIGSISENDDIGFSCEGKASYAPIGDRPVPEEPYSCASISFLGPKVVGAQKMGAWFSKGSNAEDPNEIDPNAMSAVVSDATFKECAIDNPDQGVVCGDRAANIKLTAQIISSSGKCTPVRGTWRNSSLCIHGQVNDIFAVVDTRHPIGFGSNVVPGYRPEFDINIHLANNTATHLFRTARGGFRESPETAEGTLGLTVSGYGARNTTLVGTTSTVAGDVAKSTLGNNWHIVYHDIDKGTVMEGLGVPASHFIPTIPNGIGRRLTAYDIYAAHAAAPVHPANNGVYLAGPPGWNPLFADVTAPYLTRYNSGAWQSLLPRPRSRTTAQFENAEDPINTIDKYTGKLAWNSTVGKPVFATGGAATDTWVEAAGVVVSVPR